MLALRPKSLPPLISMPIQVVLRLLLVAMIIAYCTMLISMGSIAAVYGSLMTVDRIMEGHIDFLPLGIGLALFMFLVAWGIHEIRQGWPIVVNLLSLTTVVRTMPESTLQLANQAIPEPATCEASTKTTRWSIFPNLSVTILRDAAVRYIIPCIVPGIIVVSNISSSRIGLLIGYTECTSMFLCNVLTLIFYLAVVVLYDWRIAERDKAIEVIKGFSLADQSTQEPDASSQD